MPLLFPPSSIFTRFLSFFWYFLVPPPQIFSTRARYAGEFECDRRCGYGSMHYDNGDKYVGEWLDDLRNGLGELTYRDGKSVFAEWRQDTLVRRVS